MVRVPNTSDFGLTDVVGGLDDPKTGSITDIADNGSGFIRLTASNIDGLKVGGKLTISGTIEYDGMVEVLAFTSTTIDVYESYGDPESSGTWTAVLNSLYTCFLNANSDYFDALYEDDKDEQTDFRNYGPDGALVYEDYADSGGYYGEICGNADFVFVACGFGGIRSYTVDADGTWHLEDTDSYTDYNFIGIVCNDDYVFVTVVHPNPDYPTPNSQYKVAVVMYSYDGSGNLTSEDSITGWDWDADTPHPIDIVGVQLVWMQSYYNGSQVVPALRSALIGVDEITLNDGETDDLWDAVYNTDEWYTICHDPTLSSGNIIILSYGSPVAGFNGIRALSVNQSTGKFTNYASTNEDVDLVMNIHNDGTYNYMGNELESFTLFVGVDDAGYVDRGYLAFGTWVSLKYNLIYTCRTNYIQRYRRIPPGYLMQYLGEQYYPGCVHLFIWEVRPELVLCTQGLSGVTSYSMNI